MRKQKNAFVGFGMRFDLTRARKTTSLARKKPIVLIAADLIHRNDGRLPLSCRHDDPPARKESAETSTSGSRRRRVEGARKVREWGARR